MASNDTALAILGVAAVGLAGYALLTRTATPEGEASSTAAEEAGTGNRPLQQSPQSPSASADSSVTAGARRNTYSEKWGRKVGQVIPWIAGTRVTVASSAGRSAGAVEFVGYEEATLSARWRPTGAKGGVVRIPWDTSPLDYYWDGGKPQFTSGSLPPGATSTGDPLKTALQAAADRIGPLGGQGIATAPFGFELVPGDVASFIEEQGDRFRGWLQERVK